jgi:tape measure domain-containing protein
VEIEMNKKKINEFNDLVDKSIVMSGSNQKERDMTKKVVGKVVESGLLSSEDLNSLSEFSPMLVGIIAKSIKLPPAELRNMLKDSAMETGLLIDFVVKNRAYVNKLYDSAKSQGVI